MIEGKASYREGAIPPQESQRTPEQHEHESIHGQEIWERMQQDPSFLPSRDQAVAVVHRSLGGGDSGRLLYIGERKETHPEEAAFLNEQLLNGGRELRHVREVLNAEYIRALGDYFVQRISAYGGTTEHPTVLLEVGSGDGRLVHFLKEYLDTKIPGQFTIIATDSGKAAVGTRFPVEQADYTDALQAHQPTIVISSWMPQGVDFSQGMRNTASVQEYILIGETDGGACGHTWETWGVPDWDNEDPGEDYSQAPYEKDGFQREDLDDVSKNQVSRTDDFDSTDPKNGSVSKTVSFRRVA